MLIIDIEKIKSRDETSDEVSTGVSVLLCCFVYRRNCCVCANVYKPRLFLSHRFNSPSGAV